MNREDFEKRMNLKIVRYDSSGITQTSLEWARKWERLIIPTVVYLVYVDDPNWDFVVYAVDKYGWAIRYSGFAWGYGGEGPRGLMQLLSSYGWTPPDYSHQPNAHEPGVWSVMPDGTVHTHSYEGATHE